MPTTEEEWQKLVQDVLERRSNSYVQAALQLAARFIKDEECKKQLFNNLSSVQARCTELLEDRRMLVRAIEKLARARPDDELVGEILTMAKAMQ